MLVKDVKMLLLTSRHDRASFLLPAVAKVRDLVCRGPIVIQGVGVGLVIGLGSELLCDVE